MIAVFHQGGKDPDIYYGVNEKIEGKLVKEYSRVGNVTRCSPEEWYGQDNPGYGIHHWNVSKGGRK